MTDPEQVQEILNSIRHALRLLVVATVVVYLIVIAVAVGGFVKALTVEDALCALRSDKEAQIVSSQQFLAEHPHGIPGISAATIREGIHNQQRTVDALSVISC